MLVRIRMLEQGRRSTLRAEGQVTVIERVYRGSHRHERGIGGQDQLVQLLQISPGVDPEFRIEQLADVAIGLERIGLASTAVQREHQLGEESFSRGVLRRQNFQFGDDVVAVAEEQVEVDATLCRLPSSLGPCENDIAVQRVRIHVGERGSPPQIQGPSQDPGFLGRVLGVRCSVHFGEQVVEAQQLQSEATLVSVTCGNTVATQGVTVADCENEPEPASKWVTQTKGPKRQSFECTFGIRGIHYEVR